MPVAVLYDAQCGFCRWSVDRLLRADRSGALEPVAIQSRRGGALLASVPAGLRLDAAHAVTPDGAVATGGDAVPVVAGALGGPVWRAVARASGALPGPTRTAYRLLAGRRALLGRLVPARARAAADARLAARAPR